MKDIIELHSRSKYEHHYLKKLNRPDGKESKTYTVKTSDPTVRSGTIERNRFIDLAGGPMIVEGSKLEEADAIVKYINFVVGHGYTVTFE